MNYKDYYTALGQLVYAVAMADGNIQNEEVSKVFHFAVSQIVDLESVSGHGREALQAFYTEKEFSRLRNKNVPMEEAFDYFTNFLEQNKNHLDAKMKKTCLNVMEKVAMAYNGIEDSEQKLIDEVKKKLEAL
nr:hypothetical protein [Bacteroidota bacterium]